MKELRILLREGLAKGADSAEIPAPSGMEVRSYRPGDAPHWERLAAAEAPSFHEAVRRDPAFRPYRVLFLVRDGEVVGTAFAGYEPEVRGDAGCLRHVYVPSKTDGAAGLSALCRAALSVMRADGRAAAWAPADDGALRDVLRDLGFVETVVTPVPFAHDHTDYAARTVPLQRWYPDRPVGESTGNTGDARGDESLYPPNTLGFASVMPVEVAAGENGPFTLTYQAGSQVLEQGSSVKFWMAGQGALGDAPQIQDPERVGYLEYEAPPGVRLSPLCDKVRVLSIEEGENPDRPPEPTDLIVGPITIGFRVEEGLLRDGDRVTIHVGRTAGFRWKRLTGRKEFKVIIDLGHGEPRMRLPEPVRVRIRPTAPHSLEVSLPGSFQPGRALRGSIRVRDEYDNRVPFTGSATLRSGEGAWTAHLVNGIGEFAIAETGHAPLQLAAVCEELDIDGVSNVAVPSDDEQLYFGDMHTHDFQSTAEGFPADCYQWSRDEKRLDFQSLPIQVHRWLDNEKWVIAKHMNEYFLDEGRFVTFLAFEWQHSSYGDKVIHYLGGDMPYLPVDDPRYADPKRLYEALRGTDAFIISHHPGYDLDLHVPGTRWDTVEADVDRALEIWSMHGSSEGFDPADRPMIPPKRTAGVYEGLRRGLRMGLVAGSDTHTARPGGSAQDARPYWGGLCAVWADSLTRRGLFRAFRERRTYALTRVKIALRFWVNDLPMGSEGPAADTASVRVQVWAPSPIATVQILRNTQVVHETQESTPEADVAWTDRRDGREPVFYHCRVVLDDGNLAVSSPVWLG